MDLRTRGRGFLESPLTLTVTVALFVFFLVWVLPDQSTKAAAWTPAGASFDTTFFYTPDQALNMAASWTPEGRLAYIAARWSFDFVWPLVYGAFVMCAWSFALARFPGSQRRLDRSGRPPVSRLAFLTLLGPGFDYLENIAATLLLASPQPAPFGYALVAALASAAKWIFVAAGMAGAIILPVAASIAIARSKRPRTRRADY